MTVRSLLKSAGQWTLTHAGAPWLARMAHRGDNLVLTYHGIVADEQDARRGEACLHVPRTTFAAQLDMLRDTHDIVSLVELLNDDGGKAHRPRAVITFDDAYAGAVSLGVEELAKRRLPATFFVVPAFTDGRGFWWDALAGSFGGEMPLDVRRAALLQCFGVDERVRRFAEAWRTPLMSPPEMLRCATVDQLRDASRISGITFAPHSWSHPVLSSLGPDQLRQELDRPLQWLRDHVRDVVPALAVPYGYSSVAVEVEARRLGYTAIFPGHGGWVSSRGRLPFTLPRQSVPAGLSQRGFALRSSGLVQ